MTGPRRVRLADGIVLRPMPFGGAFVVDLERLAAQEICTGLAALLSGGAETEQSAGSLAAQVEAGLRDGWLTAVPAEGSA
jgi:hypothetical protein